MKLEPIWIKGGWQRDLLILCLFIVMGGLVYINSLSNSFQYDDTNVILDNRNMHTLKNIPYFFINPKMLFADPYLSDGHYRPLVVTSFAINYVLGGLNPVGYHLVNLAFHVGAAFMIFLIVKAMSGSRRDRPSGLSVEEAAGSRKESRIQNPESRSKRQDGAAQFIGQRGKIEEDPDKLDAYKIGGLFAAFAAGLIFLVHPFNSEVVNYITARFSVMSGFFYLLAFWCWVRFRSQNSEVRIQKSEFRSQKKSYFLPLTSCFYLGSLLAFVAGMLSKEVVITLPVVLWLYDLYFYRSSPAPATRSLDRPEGLSLRLPATYLNWRTYISYLPFVFTGLLPYLLIRLSSFGKALPAFQRDIVTQLFTELPVLVKYLRMFLIPAPLTPAHYVKIYQTFWSLPVISSAILLIIYTAIAIFFFRLQSHPWRVISFFMFWFFIVLLPTTIIPLNAILQENRGYLAVVSFAISLGMAIGWGGKTRVRGIVIIILAVLITLYSVGTFQRNKVWKDALTLWSDAMKKSPRSLQVYRALGVTYLGLKNYDQAIEASSRAVVLGGKKDFVAHATLGSAYGGKGKWDLALVELKTAVELNPYFVSGHFKLGVIYYTMGKMDLAEREFQEVIRLDPENDQPYFYLGAIYTTQRRLDQAIQIYQKAIPLFPEEKRLKSQLLMGDILEGVGKKREAAEQYLKVMQQAGEGEENLAREARRRLERMGLLR